MADQPAAFASGFLLPLALVRDVIVEREGRRAGAASEIGESWGRAQRVFGPILVIPYREPQTEADIAAQRAPTEREIRLMLLEDQALLVGSIGLFLALSAIMLVTRRIDWYALGARAPAADGP